MQLIILDIIPYAADKLGFVFLLPPIEIDGQKYRAVRYK
jgi:hypothetical protein